ncbi:hypothetical protein [Geochorda subterranea]|uniref:FlgN protein n=1 Tax=Geochorda subterranea TaxID=3109564 RepID=A0ABZ1BN13_9FIRM|nr:hypothetical protein [Limnochorda sp. LNt]WRP13988.1 hypothetical protein VLY81_11215 [Limnochorda sp. LNt]
MEHQHEPVAIVERLRQLAGAIQQAVRRNDVAGLPELAREEAELARRLADQLAAAPAVPDALRDGVRSWWALHEQNRLLLQHAHHTVLALLDLLAGAGNEPAGLYSPQAATGGGRRDAVGRVAAAVDRRV